MYSESKARRQLSNSFLTAQKRLDPSGSSGIQRPSTENANGINKLGLEVQTGPACSNPIQHVSTKLRIKGSGVRILPSAPPFIHLNSMGYGILTSNIFWVKFCFSNRIVTAAIMSASPFDCLRNISDQGHFDTSGDTNLGA